MTGSELDRVLEKLAKDVEAAVHQLYRGEVRQMTAKARTDGIVQQAKATVAQLTGAGPRPSTPVAVSPRPSVAAPLAVGAAVGWSKEEGEAVMRCITAWLPMGDPRTAAPDSKCVAGGRDLVPAWGQRELARTAVRKLAAP